MASATPFQIIIVGGGIGGLSAAIALRAPGRQITVLEQSRLHSEIGATISLQPNASKILKVQWKLSKEILDVARGMVDRGFRIYDWDGKLVNSVPLVEREEYGADRIMYHRQDLHECLKRAATCPERDGPPAIVRVSSRVVACDCEAGIVTLETGEEIRANLVVGADGIHSTLRSFVLDGEVIPKSTGLSAYRFMVSSKILEDQAPTFCENIPPKEPFTSMVMAHNCRLIMGPTREAEIYSVVGLVPDEKMNEDPDMKQSWVSRGDLDKMLETYQEFPSWTKVPFKLAENIGLWQLRDIDPLKTWTKGRVILIGDAAHAMLPTQGQGASQTIEDAEALGAFFEDVFGVPDPESIADILQEVFQCRYNRASLIQRYSREAAKPATDKDSNEVKM